MNKSMQRPEQGLDVHGRVNIGNVNDNIRLYDVPKTLSKLFNYENINFSLPATHPLPTPASLTHSLLWFGRLFSKAN